MYKTLIAIAVAIAATLAPGTPAQADAAGIFGRGKTHFVITAGSGYAFNENYLLMGVGISYYLLDGLSIGLAGEYWASGSPTIYKVSPSVNYVFHQLPAKPYVGAFYRRTYVERLPDINSAGARAGIYFPLGSNRAFMGLGGVYEAYVDCNRAVYRACDDVYPELTFTFAF